MKATEISATSKLEDFTWFAGYLFGQDKAVAPETGLIAKTSSSLWISYKFSDLLAVLTYDSRTSQPDNSHTHWAHSTSAALTYDVNETHHITARYEVLEGANEIGYGAAVDKVQSITLADKIIISENLALYVEYRVDQADENAFLDENNSVTKKDASLITLGALASF
ncbi:MAG: outer membrane beta-barrel protein [Bdellovibrio sp.]